MTRQSLYKHALACLKSHTPSPQADAIALICHTLNLPKTAIYSHPETTITLSQAKTLEKLLQRRLTGEPIAYIIGQKAFWNYIFKVNSNTLIPRPETEHLIELALNLLPPGLPLNVADLGTGCGAIALTLAMESPQWTIYATDNSQKALEVAKTNAEAFKCQNVIFSTGDWLAALPQKLTFDAIISNPPYIADHDPDVEPSVRAFEPHAALFANENGLAAIRTIIESAPLYLKPHGLLFIEHGACQAPAVVEILEKSHYTSIKTELDWSGKPRVTYAQKT